MEQLKLIELKNISKTYDDDTVLEDLNLYILKNEFITLLGPSGCGKTTTLRIIAGFEQPTSGNVYFNGADITNVPPYKRHVNTVFQKYALFPNMNVYNNIAFGLKIQKLKSSEIDRRVNEALELIDLPNYGHRKIDSFSDNFSACFNNLSLTITAVGRSSSPRGTASSFPRYVSISRTASESAFSARSSVSP